MTTNIPLPDLLRLLDAIQDSRAALTECRDVLRALLNHFVYVESLAIFDDAKHALERAELTLKEK
jgi:hypothetical protein